MPIISSPLPLRQWKKEECAAVCRQDQGRRTLISMRRNIPRPSQLCRVGGALQPARQAAVCPRVPRRINAAGVANAFYAIGRHLGIGYSPFGIDDAGRLLALRPEGNQADPGPPPLRDLPLPKGYAARLRAAKLEAQARGDPRPAHMGASDGRTPGGHDDPNMNLLRYFRDPDDGPPFG